MTYEEIRDIINNSENVEELQDIINQLSEALKAA
jgi:hypothetical protein